MSAAIKRKGRNILRDANEEALRIEPYTNGDFLESTGFFQVKLTPAVARKLITELRPYTEWLPPGTDRRTGKPIVPQEKL